MGVIPVVGSRLENGVEINRRYPQVLQVIQMFDDPEQIATFETVRCGGRFPGFQVVRLTQVLAAGESIGEDLIEDGVVDPGGRSEGRHFGFVILDF
jgi:hypothetical protein